MTPRILALPAQHRGDCDVCGGRGVVTLHALRWRDGVEFAVRVGRILRCPLMSGADSLRAEVGVSGSAPVGPEGGAA